MGVTRLAPLCLGCTAFAGLGLLLASTASSDTPLRFPAEVVSVRALPTNHVLKRGTLNVVVAKPGLAFKVTIRSTSIVSRTATVRLVIPRAIRGPVVRPVVKLKTLRLTRDQWKAVTFANLGQIQFVVRMPLKVSLETKVGNVVHVATVAYPVIFSLG